MAELDQTQPELEMPFAGAPGADGAVSPTEEPALPGAGSPSEGNINASVINAQMHNHFSI